MSLASQLQNLATRIASECKSLRTLINGNAADNSALQTTAKNLVGAINELRASVLGAGSGDMSKATYDTNNNGKVDAADTADAVPWSGVTGKPSQFPPAPHDASLLTGTIDPARLPVIPSQVQVVSTSATIAGLTTAEQAQITGPGVIVTTTDGMRWVYRSGTKTLEASYVSLGDITPEWGVIANKPTTRAGYGITDAQALDATLTALAGLTTAANQLIYSTGADAFAMASLTAFGRSLIDDADASAARTTLGLGTAATAAASAFAAAVHGHAISDVTNLQTTLDGKQAADATLTALAGVLTAADKLIYATGADTFETTNLTAFARSLLAGADAAAVRTTLQLGSAALAATGDFASAAAVGNTETDFVATFNLGLV